MIAQRHIYVFFWHIYDRRSYRVVLWAKKYKTLSTQASYTFFFTQNRSIRKFVFMRSIISTWIWLQKNCKNATKLNHNCWKVAWMSKFAEHGFLLFNICVKVEVSQFQWIQTQVTKLWQWKDNDDFAYFDFVILGQFSKHKVRSIFKEKKVSKILLHWTIAHMYDL